MNHYPGRPAVGRGAGNRTPLRQATKVATVTHEREIKLLTPDTLVRVWTVQPLAVYEKLQSQGVLKADGRYVVDFLREGYAWLRPQAKARVEGWKSSSMWWAHLYPKPDLRHSHIVTYFPAGVKAVRLELAIPYRRLLLSDYDIWSWYVLNKFHYGTSREQRAWEKELRARKLHLAYTADLPADLQERIVKSWERIFALGSSRPARKMVQANFEKLYLEDVVGVTHFIAQPRAGI